MMQNIDEAFLKLRPINELENNSHPKKILSADIDGNLFLTEYDELKAFVVTGIKGEATPASSPTAWLPGQPDLYEKYDVKIAGTYTNFKDQAGQAIVVTADPDLLNNYVQIWVKNGVSQKALAKKPKTDGLDEVKVALKWFLAQTTDVADHYKIQDSGIRPMFGINATLGAILKTDNTTRPISAPNVTWFTFLNVPVAANGISRIKLKIVPYPNSTPGDASLVGITSGGVKQVLVPQFTPNPIKEVEFDVTGFQTISLGWVLTDASPETLLQEITFYNAGGSVVEDIVKDYIDTKVSTEIIINKTLYAQKYGLKESNTESQNKAIMDNLINIAYTECRSIELPEGQYPITNVVMKPCNMYGKDRNTVFTSNTAAPMFVMEPAWGVANINNHTMSGKAGGYYTGFELAGFGLKGNGVATKGLWLGVHAFANYERLFFHGFTDVALHTEGMLICNFRDIQMRSVQNGIRSDKGIGQGLTYAANLVIFDILNIEGCKGIAFDWKNGSAVHLNAFDAEITGTGTSGDNSHLNTGVISFSNPYGDYIGGMGLTITNSWSENNYGGFYARLTGDAIHTFRDTQVLRLGGNAVNSIVNNGGKVLIDNSVIKGGPLLTTGANAKTYVSGFSDITSHSENTGGTFKTASYV